MPLGGAVLAGKRLSAAQSSPASALVRLAFKRAVRLAGCTGPEVGNLPGNGVAFDVPAARDDGKGERGETDEEPVLNVPDVVAVHHQ